MHYLRRLLSAGALLCVLLGAQSAMALEIPSTPSTPIVDQTGTLSPDQINSLAALTNTERTQSGSQIAVLMIPSLEGDSLEDYSLRVARGWGIGEKGKNNGVLLLVVKNDRKLRIEDQ